MMSQLTREDIGTSSTEQSENTTSAAGQEVDINPAPRKSQETEPTKNSPSLQAIRKVGELASAVLESKVGVSTPRGVEALGSGQANSKAEKSKMEERGYDYELMNSEKEKVEMCFICHLIPRKPKKLSCCGNTFCTDCIHKEINCPLCRADDFKTMIDKKCERKINDLVVHCPNHNKGCDWAGELRNVEEHLNKDPSRRDGLVKGCGHQMAPCERCEELVTFVQMKMHLEEDCSHRLIPCEFELAGCNFRGPKYGMSEHIQCNMLQHLSLMAKSLKENKDCVSALESSNLRKQWSIRKGNLTQFFLFFALVCALIIILLFYYQSRVQLIQDQIKDNTHSYLIHEDICAALQKDIGQVQGIQDNLSKLKADFDIKLNKFSLEMHSLDRDLHEGISEGKINFSQLTNAMQSLVDDVQELKNGFSKKYIDNIINEIKNIIFPKRLTSSIKDSWWTPNEYSK